MGSSSSKNTTAVTQATAKVRDALTKLNSTEITVNVANNITLANISGSKVQVLDIIQSADAQLIASLTTYLELNNSRQTDVLSQTDLKGVLSSSLDALSGNKISFKVENYTTSDIQFITEVFNQTTSRLQVMNNIIINNVANSDVAIQNVQQNAKTAIEMLIEDTASSLNQNASKLSASLIADLQTVTQGMAAEMSQTVQTAVKEINATLDNAVTQVGTATNVLAQGAADSAVNVSEGASSMLNTTKYFLIGGAIFLVVMVIAIAVVAVSKQKTKQQALSWGMGKKNKKRKARGKGELVDKCGCEDGLADKCGCEDGAKKKKRKHKGRKFKDESDNEDDTDQNYDIQGDRDKIEGYGKKKKKSKSRVGKK
jgi:hypothetical protein